MARFVAILAALGVLVACPILTHASTIYVPDDHNTIQGAVDVAEEGDTIIVRDGAYSENITIDVEELELRSLNGSASVVLRASTPSDPILTVIADSVTVRGLGIIGSNDVAIEIIGASHCSILENSIIEATAGIRISGSASDNVVSHNSVDSCTSGIGVHSDSNRNQILNNSVLRSDCRSIYLEHCEGSVVTGNVCNAGTYGIVIKSAIDSTLRSNTMDGNLYGFNVWGTPRANDVDSSNLVDGKPIHYLVSVSDYVVPPNSGPIVIVDSTEITVQDVVIDGAGDGIIVSGSHSCLIADCNVTTSAVGIRVMNSSAIVVVNNTLDNNGTGIWLDEAEGCTLDGNAITNCRYSTGCGGVIGHGYGVLLLDSDGNTISSNTVNQCERIGLFIGHYSNANLATGNTVNGDTEYGVLLNLANSNSLVDNTISNCDQGIRTNSASCTFTGNISAENTYGLVLSHASRHASSNVFARNRFGGNATCIHGGVGGNEFYLNDIPDGALTYAPGNTWTSQNQVTYCFSGIEHESHVGNWWGAAYVGTDSDTDGIGDSPYEFDSSTDTAPLMESIANYVCSSDPPHSVSRPATPSNPTHTQPGIELSITVNGSTCSQGHAVEYRVDWGDGEISGWSSGSTFSHTYATESVYGVKGQARCSTNPGLESGWSAELLLELRSGNQPPQTSIDSADIDEALGTASFHWSAVDDDTPAGELEYCFRLLGNSSPHKSWSVWEKKTRHEFTNLPADSYRFQVRARDSGLRVDSSPASRDFSSQLQDEGSPLARSSDIGNQPEAMWVGLTHFVTARYYMAPGRSHLDSCYLMVKHPSWQVTFEWKREDGSAQQVGDDGSGDAIVAVSGAREIVDEEGREGYELTWRFRFGTSTPDLTDGVGFGVSAKSRGGIQSDWQYDSSDISIAVRTHLVAYLPIRYKGEGSAPAETRVEVSPLYLQTRARLLELYFAQVSYGEVVIGSVFAFRDSDGMPAFQELPRTWEEYDGELTWEEVDDELILRIHTDRGEALQAALEVWPEGRNIGEPSEYDAIVLLCPEMFISNARHLDTLAPGLAGGLVFSSSRADYSVWAHELGHAIFGWYDYYKDPSTYYWSRGNGGYWGLMTAGVYQNPPPPVMAFNCERAGWLEYAAAYLDETVAISDLQTTTQGQSPIVYTHVPTAGDVDHFIFEGRDPPGILPYKLDMSLRQKVEGDAGVLVYQVVVDDSLPDLAECLYPIPRNHRTLRSDGRTVTLTPGDVCKRPEEGVKFSLRKRSGEMELTISTYRPIRLNVTSLLQTNMISQLSALSEPPSTPLELDIDLHVIDEYGRHVGVDYASGIYEVEIPGADASGDTPGGGPEWIELPEDIVATAYLELSDALQQLCFDTPSLDPGSFSGRLRFSHFDSTGLRTQSMTRDVDVGGDEAVPVTPPGIGESPPEQVSLVVAPNPVSTTGCAFLVKAYEGSSALSIAVYSLTGRRVFAFPLDEDSLRYPAVGFWNPADSSGAPLANGPYLCALTSDGKVIATAKMVIMR